jgi:hypothetical protein
MCWFGSQPSFSLYRRSDRVGWPQRPHWRPARSAIWRYQFHRSHIAISHWSKSIWLRIKSTSAACFERCRKRCLDGGEGIGHFIGVAEHNTSSTQQGDVDQDLREVREAIDGSGVQNVGCIAHGPRFGPIRSKQGRQIAGANVHVTQHPRILDDQSAKLVARDILGLDSARRWHAPRYAIANRRANAAVVAWPGLNVDDRSCRQAIQEHFGAGFASSIQVVPVERVPLNEQGKPGRTAIRQLAQRPVTA